MRRWHKQEVVEIVQAAASHAATAREVSAELGAVLVATERVPESQAGKGVAIKSQVATCICMLGGERTSRRSPVQAFWPCSTAFFVGRSGRTVAFTPYRASSRAERMPSS